MIEALIAWPSSLTIVAVPYAWPLLSTLSGPPAKSTGVPAVPAAAVAGTSWAFEKSSVKSSLPSITVSPLTATLTVLKGVLASKMRWPAAGW